RSRTTTTRRSGCWSGSATARGWSGCPGARSPSASASDGVKILLTRVKAGATRPARGDDVVPAGTMLRSGRGSSLVLVVAVLAPLAVCGLLVPLREVVTTRNAALVLVIVVVAVAATGRRSAGILAALSGFVWLDVLLIPPYGTLAIADPDD